MKEKHLKIFAGIFLCLLIIFFITKPRHAGVNIDEFVQNILIGISAEDVKSIEAYKESSSDSPIQLTFTKNQDQWHIATHFNCKAQNSRIDKLLTDLIEMTGKVRTSDPKHLESYQITDAQGIHLLLKDEGNKTLANLIIGKKSEDLNASFIRFVDKEKVYSTDKNLLSSLGITGDIDTLSLFATSTFVELQAVNQDKEKLETVALVSNKKELIVKKIQKEVEYTAEDSTQATKIEEEWVLSQGNNEIELVQSDVESFFRDILKVRGQEVVDRLGNSLGDINKNSRYGFSRPNHYIVFKKADSAQENVIFGNTYDDDSGYYMNVQYDGLVYKVTKSNFDRVFKWIEDLPTKTK